MFKSERSDAPTMILPRGADIDVDSHGQLSIRTPGSLVVQNSGRFGVLESTGGSISIEAGVSVEAVSVACAQTCLVQGALTAWRVSARSIHLDRSAQANIILQEAEELVIGQDARLVGNFGSENELMGLFSRYARQLGQISFPVLEEGRTAVAEGREEASRERSDLAGRELPERLLFSTVLLERELERRRGGPISKRILEELLELVRSGDDQLLSSRSRPLFRRLSEPGRDARRAAELIGQYLDELRGSEEQEGHEEKAEPPPGSERGNA